MPATAGGAGVRRADGAGVGLAGDGREPHPWGGDGSDGLAAGSSANGGSASEGPATNGWLFKGGTRAMVTALRQAFKPRLAAYPGPTLIVNGEEDDLFRYSERAFLEATVDGRLVVIPGSGHEVNEDQPEAFNAVVRDFADEVRWAVLGAGRS